MFYIICIALFLPLLSFLFLSMLGRYLNRSVIHFIGCMAVFLPFLCFAYAAYTFPESTEFQSFHLAEWISLKNLHANFTLHLDHLSLLMTLIITGVGFLIHVYSIGYMEDDPAIGRYFACLNLFIFSMLLLVLAGDLLLLFVGWEGVGLASYLLIGFWYEKISAANAATKSFVVNRIGDFGFLLGILLTFSLFGTTDIESISANAASIAIPTLTLLTCLYLCGAVAKSAQIPLHVWLPDAMEGPTPVSALIHAATMVTAGVYLMARLHPLFILTPTTLMWVGIIGGTTALIGSLAALNQTDLKKVLAYSTISQLGLMFLASGIGAFYAAMFHLTTHAFMKALLFLSAGNVIHAVHGTTEMDQMGGLAKPLKITHWLFLIGVLAMSGIPPFAAFFSKDLILEAEYLSGHHVLFIVAVIASILTAIYLTRAYFLTFRGRLAQDHSKVHEVSSVMLIPVAVLAVLASIGGFLGFSLNGVPFLENYLRDLGITHAEHDYMDHFWTKPETWLSISMAVFGVGVATLLYTTFRDRLRPPLELLKKAFYFDEIYNLLVVIPYSGLASLIARGIEPHVLDQMVHASSLAVNKTAYGLQRTQSGQIRSYAAWMVIGGVCLLIYFIS